MNKQTIGAALVVAVTLGLAGGCTPTPKETGKVPKFIGAARELPPPPPANPIPIDPALKAQARAEIAAAARSPDPIIRAHALESIRQVGGTDGIPDVLRGLSDREGVVRFAATLAAGEMKLTDAHQTLLNMLNDPEPTVRVGVRFALHKLGDKRFSHDLEKYARNPDLFVRADTAMVLGLLGEPSGLVVLKEMQFDHDSAVRVQVAEAMWRLGNTDGREQLVAATVGQYVNDQAIAYMGLAGPKDPEVLSHIRSGLLSPYDQVALVAARAAGVLGSDHGYPLAMAGAKSRDPMNRMLAGFALGAIGRTEAQPVLAKLVVDPVPDVRLAAATAILLLREGH